MPIMRPEPRLRSRRNTAILHSLLAAVTVATCLLAGSWFYRSLLDVTDLAEPAPEVGATRDPGGSRRVIGVISRFNPTITYRGYQPLVDYLSRSTPYSFELRLGRDYRSTVDLVAEGKVEAAFLGSFVYCRSGYSRGIRPILKPRGPQGKAVFRSVLVARDDLPVAAGSTLEGRRIAVPSEDSFSGNWLLEPAMNDLGASRDTFSEVRHFAHHHSVVFQILRGRYELGVVKDRVAAEFLDRGLGILSRSPPIPGSPLVVGPRTDPAVERALSEALLALAPQGSGIPLEDLERWDRELRHGFAPALASDYTELCAQVTGVQEAPG